MRKFVLSAALIVATGGAAHAADLGGVRSGPLSAPEPIDTGFHPFTWTGFYLGANGGYGWGNPKWTFPDTADTLAFEETGGMVGGQVGLNWQFARSMVMGVEGTLDWANISGKGLCPDSDANCKTHMNSISDVSGRLGFAFNRFLIYGKGGVAFANMDHLTTSLVDAGLNTRSGYDLKTGYLVGGGLEYALTDHLSWKIEYNYMNFGSGDFYSLNNATTGAAGSINEDQSLNAVKTGLSFKF